VCGRLWTAAELTREHFCPPTSAFAATGARQQEGYEFSILGDLDVNVWDRFRVPYDRIRHGLAFAKVTVRVTGRGCVSPTWPHLV
jgi:hypothetical protein